MTSEGDNSTGRNCTVLIIHLRPSCILTNCYLYPSGYYATCYGKRYPLRRATSSCHKTTYKKSAKILFWEKYTRYTRARLIHLVYVVVFVSVLGICLNYSVRAVCYWLNVFLPVYQKQKLVSSHGFLCKT